MKRTTSTLLLVTGSALVAVTTLAQAGDPVRTDGDKYRIVAENGGLRVLRYHDEPGAKTHPHHHPRFVMIALSSFRRRLTFADGTSKVRDFSAGDAFIMPAQEHTGENVGSTPTDAILVEFGHGASRSP